MNILCLKQVPFEGPASIAKWASGHGHSLTECEVFRGGPLPAPGSFDCLLIMGGPMNIHEEATHPWLAAEKRLIHAAIADGKIVVGICLGAQLIADALGAPVTRAAHPEIGWFPIRRARNAPEWLDLPDELRVFHWHGDTFALPDGAAPLAESDGCAQQGFLYDDRVLAWQCHLETTADSLGSLASACGDEIGKGPYTLDIPPPSHGFIRQAI